jgi:hypothetical protein
MLAVMWLMVSCPPLHHSKVRREAFRRFSSATEQMKSDPNPETKRELELSLQNLEEAKRQDRNFILAMEAILACFLGYLVIAFLRAGKRRTPKEPAHAPTDDPR